MKTLTLNEIGRTAFVGSNQTCPYCKNKHTDEVMDSAYLEPFKAFYKDKKFSVKHCYCCTAVFSLCGEKELTKSHEDVDA